MLGYNLARNPSGTGRKGFLAKVRNQQTEEVGTRNPVSSLCLKSSNYGITLRLIRQRQTAYRVEAAPGVLETYYRKGG